MKHKLWGMSTITGRIKPWYIGGRKNRPFRVICGALLFPFTPVLFRHVQFWPLCLAKITPQTGKRGITVMPIVLFYTCLMHRLVGTSLTTIDGSSTPFVFGRMQMLIIPQTNGSSAHSLALCGKLIQRKQDSATRETAPAIFFDWPVDDNTTNGKSLTNAIQFLCNVRAENFGRFILVDFGFQRNRGKLQEWFIMRRVPRHGQVKSVSWYCECENASRYPAPVQHVGHFSRCRQQSGDGRSCCYCYYSCCCSGRHCVVVGILFCCPGCPRFVLVVGVFRIHVPAYLYYGTTNIHAEKRRNQHNTTTQKCVAITALLRDAKSLESVSEDWIEVVVGVLERQCESCSTSLPFPSVSLISIMFTTYRWFITDRWRTDRMLFFPFHSGSEARLGEDKK